MPTFHVEAGENYILATPSWPTVGAKRWALDTLSATPGGTRLCLADRAAWSLLKIILHELMELAP